AAFHHRASSIWNLVVYPSPLIRVTVGRGTSPAVTRLPHRSPRHDSQTRLRQIPALFAQKESENRQAAQSRPLCQPRRRAEARARRAIFQARMMFLLPSLRVAGGGSANFTSVK